MTRIPPRPLPRRVRFRRTGRTTRIRRTARERMIRTRPPACFPSAARKSLFCTAAGAQQRLVYTATLALHRGRRTTKACLHRKACFTPRPGGSEGTRPTDSGRPVDAASDPSRSCLTQRSIPPAPPPSRPRGSEGAPQTRSGPERMLARRAATPPPAAANGGGALRRGWTGTAAG